MRIYISLIYLLLLLGIFISPVHAESVGIVRFTFEPDSVTIDPGTTVTWTNMDIAVHSVTSEDGIFDSGSLPQGHSFEYTFTEPGTYAYFSTPHPYMTGEIIVAGEDLIPLPEEEDTDGPFGFALLIAIIGIAAIAYLVLRRD
ncbi:cupredoxin domain-containing protein [Methanocalculus chunghsingensis]|uniref:cupredoxin domain-containing protein n=1 Tax=Methanocalculus chunghsingensis TaxID=156457 RepID=UPI001B8C6D29|nr:cupredoxin family copper-binding protein [Methanocalculus chunghsingensis]